LSELAHFTSPNRTYEATFDPAEGPIVDRDRPFERCTLLQLPKSSDHSASRSVVGLATGFLFRELLTQFGRHADTVRNETIRHLSTAPAFLTVGTFRLAWPRFVLLGRAAHRCAERVVQTWLNLDADALAAPIAAALQDDWARRQLDPEAILDRLRASSQTALRSKSEQLYDTLFAVDGAGSQAQLTTDAVSLLIDDVLRFIGQPVVQGQLTSRGLVNQILEESVQQITNETTGCVIEMAGAFLERPGYRFTGAEGAIGCLVQRIRSIIEQLESQGTAPRRDALDSYNRIVAHAEALDAAKWNLRRSAITRELIIELRIYARLQLESLFQQGLSDMYRGVVNASLDFLRDVQYQRKRVEALHGRFATPLTGSEIESYLGPGKMILPAGCRNVKAVVERFTSTLTSEQLIELDTRIQGQIQKQFKSLAGFCRDSTDQTHAMAAAVIAQTLSFIEPRFGHTNAAAVFFQDSTTEQAAYRAVMQAFDEAAPELAAQRAQPDQQYCLLSVPDNPDGMRFARIAESTITDAPITTITGTDDIVFHCEQMLAAAELPQLSAFAKEAFVQITNAEQAPPHSRCDIQWMEVAK